MRMAPHQWIKCLGQKGRGVRLRSNICQVKKLSASTCWGKTLSLWVITSSWSPHHAGLLLNGPMPWPHERCSGTMSITWLVIAVGRCTQSLVSFNNAPCHFSTERKKSWYRRLSTKPNLSCHILLWNVGAWSKSYYGYKIGNSEW